MHLSELGLGWWGGNSWVRGSRGDTGWDQGAVLAQGTGGREA